MKQVTRGFTLIELMIVIAIIGILAAIAVPSYQTYTNKAKFTEVVQATSPYKLAVEICAHNTAALTACGNGSNGVPAAAGASGYVASVTTSANGVITATSQNLPTNYSFVLTPSMDATSGQITWQRGGTCVAAGVC